MRTYHACAAHYNGSKTHWWHGVLRLPIDLDLMGNGKYAELCDMIGNTMNPPCSGKDIVVHSLTVIAEEPLAG